MSYPGTEIIQRGTVAAMIDAYKRTCADIDTANELLKNAENRIRQSVGKDGTWSGSMTIFPYNWSVTKCKQELKRSCWQTILNRLEIEKVMSIKDLEKFRKSFDDPEKIPELELETVMNISYGLVSSASEYAKRLVEEVFDILTPGRRESNRHVTNIKNARKALGKKVILTYVLEEVWCSRSNQNPFRVGYMYSRDRVAAVDKVFHTLDGKGIPGGYITPLIDAIDRTGPDGKGETEYFRFWCYKNRNLHLEFKRLDLVRRLNEIAGAGNCIAD